MSQLWLLLLLMTGVGQLQGPQFEVASIRAVPHGQEGMTSLDPYGGGPLTVKNGTLQYLITMAYGVQPKQILGQPDWLGVRQYDVSAKPEGDGRLTFEQMRPMLQRLLVQRFHLAVHRELREEAGSALVVAKGGTKLTPGKEGTANYILRDGIRSPGMSLAGLATMLAIPAGKPVVDRTGVEGLYEIKLSFAPDGVAESSLPSLFTAVEQQMGLKLVPQKVPVEVLVIDHVESEPTEN